MRNIWKDGVFGVVIGDALGCPVQFEDRSEVALHPVTNMRGNGTFNLPAGSWTDDSSMTLALLESICRTSALDLKDIMNNFVNWLDNGAFTPYGKSFDIGNGTIRAITAYKHKGKPRHCGGTSELNNGNGSLMRILPACLYCYRKELTDSDAIREIHDVGSLTHAHIRSNIACGLYYFMICEVLEGTGELIDRLQKGLDRGFAFYEKKLADHENILYYNRLRDLTQFAREQDENIKSTGYVVDTLEAVVWSLITTSSFEEALLKAVNLGNDTDTVGAITGGLAALFYGFDAIPSQWIQEIKKRESIEKLCEMTDYVITPLVGRRALVRELRKENIDEDLIIEVIRDYIKCAETDEDETVIKVAAREIWEKWPEERRNRNLQNVHCSKCGRMASLASGYEVAYKLNSNTHLILHGQCSGCSAEIWHFCE